MTATNDGINKSTLKKSNFKESYTNSPVKPSKKGNSEVT